MRRAMRYAMSMLAGLAVWFALGVSAHIAPAQAQDAPAPDPAQSASDAKAQDADGEAKKPETPQPERAPTGRFIVPPDSIVHTDQFDATGPAQMPGTGESGRWTIDGSGNFVFGRGQMGVPKKTVHPGYVRPPGSITDLVTPAKTEPDDTGAAPDGGALKSLTPSLDPAQFDARAVRPGHVQNRPSSKAVPNDNENVAGGAGTDGGKKHGDGGAESSDTNGAEKPEKETQNTADENVKVDPTLVAWLTGTTVVLAFIFIGLYSIACRKQDRDAFARNFLILTVIFAALFLIVAGYTEQQIAPAYALLGSIVGYLFGVSQAGAGSNAKDEPPEEAKQTSDSAPPDTEKPPEPKKPQAGAAKG